MAIQDWDHMDLDCPNRFQEQADDGKRLRFQAGICQDALDLINFYQTKA